MRTSYDFSPLFRSSIGFDRIFDLLENAARVQTSDNWPPYDIEKTGEDRYRITMAVAGFSRDELDAHAEPNLLVVSGAKPGRRERAVSPSRHRRARFRAPLRARRPRQGGRRQPRQRPAHGRARARAARGDEAAPDRDPGASRAPEARAAADRAAEAGGLTAESGDRPAAPVSAGAEGRPVRAKHRTKERRRTMNVRDLIPWGRGNQDPDPASRRAGESPSSRCTVR